MFQKAQHRWYVFTASFTERERVLFLATSFVLGLAMVTALASPPLGPGGGSFSVDIPSAGGEAWVVGLPLPDIQSSNPLLFAGLHAVEGPDAGVRRRTHVVTQREGGRTSGSLGSAALREVQSRWGLLDVAGYRAEAGQPPFDLGIEVELLDGAEWAVLGPFELRYRVGMRRHAFTWCATVVLHLGTQTPADAEAESSRRLAACDG